MMIEKIGKPAMLEQLAEEAAELSKAALKMARILRGENPTPVTMSEANRKLIEEYTDVYQCAMELEIFHDWAQIHLKTERFLKRWNESERKKIISGNTLLPKSKILDAIQNVGGCDTEDEFAKGWDAACNAIYREVQEK